MPFLLPDHEHQSTEGSVTYSNGLNFKIGWLLKLISLSVNIILVGCITRMIGSAMVHSKQRKLIKDIVLLSDQVNVFSGTVLPLLSWINGH